MKKLFFLSTLLLGLAVSITSCDGNGGDDDDTTPKKKYELGQLYNENGVQGVVYELSADKTSGKIVSLTETLTPFSTDSVNSAVGATDADGKVNTAKFIAAGAQYAAANWAVNTLTPRDSFYIPAAAELTKMLNTCCEDAMIDSLIKHCGDLNIVFKGVFYYSSTEAGATKMKAKRQIDASTTDVDKTAVNVKTRAIAKF